VRSEETNRDERDEREPARGGDAFPETEEHPAPGIKHEPEPDAENIMPAEDRPGTL
jgi:hypothetical protein